MRPLQVLVVLAIVLVTAGPVAVGVAFIPGMPIETASVWAMGLGVIMGFVALDWTDRRM